jgi:hypothetical protein
MKMVERANKTAEQVKDANAPADEGWFASDDSLKGKGYSVCC